MKKNSIIGAVIIIILLIVWVFWNSPYAASLGLRDPKNYTECLKVGGQATYPNCDYKGMHFYGGPQ
jgi:hypothetical protein